MHRHTALPIVLAFVLSGCDAPSTGTLFFEPAALYVEGWFGYDAEAREAVAYHVAEGAVVPTVVIDVMDDRYFDDSDTFWRCSITLTYDTGAHGNLPAASWASGDVWFGFSLTEDAVVDSDCVGWDPLVWGDDPVADLAAQTWGLGLSALAPDVAEQLEATVIQQYGEDSWTRDWQPEVFGGGFFWEGAESTLDSGFLAHDYGFAAAVDADFQVIVDVQGLAQTIPADDVLDGAPPSGAYALLAWYGVDALLATMESP